MHHPDNASHVVHKSRELSNENSMEKKYFLFVQQKVLGASFFENISVGSVGACSHTLVVAMNMALF